MTGTQSCTGPGLKVKYSFGKSENFSTPDMPSNLNKMNYCIINILHNKLCEKEMSFDKVIT